ncbi:MAG: hypothetical protein LC777_08755, partial [Actinobacteria bacterium]|nr:hypothetical protein [Actinomycetota bacterium]
DVDDRAVEPAPAPPLLGGVTIKRRRRGAPSPNDVAAPDAPTQPATLPPAPTPAPAPPVAPAQPAAERELVEPAVIAPDRARSDQAAGADVAARRLASMRRTLAGRGSSPLLDSLEEDLKRLRARERRDD